MTHVNVFLAKLSLVSGSIATEGKTLTSEDARRESALLS